MTYIVEYIEEESKRFRAVEVESDSLEYADVEAMRNGAKILKLKKIYPKRTKEHKHTEGTLCTLCADIPFI